MAAECRIIQSREEVFGVVDPTGSLVAAVGVRIGVAPGINVVRIVGVGIVCNQVFRPFGLPDQTCDIVPDHGPGGGGFRQVVTRGVQLGVGAVQTNVLGILSVIWLTRRRAQGYRISNAL